MNFALNLSALPERLREKIYIEPNTGCWLWMSSTNPDGYGIGNLDGGRDQAAHRLIWQVLHGSIAVRLHHKCHTRLCVNPTHLEDLTDQTHGLQHRKKICKQGHDLTKPDATYKNGSCKICHKLRQKYSNRKRRVQLREYQREWRRRNTQKTHEYWQRWYNKKIKKSEENYCRRSTEPTAV